MSQTLFSLNHIALAITCPNMLALYEIGTKCLFYATTNIQVYISHLKKIRTSYTN